MERCDCPGSGSSPAGGAHPQRQFPAAQQQHVAAGSVGVSGAIGQALDVAACEQVNARIMSQPFIRTPHDTELPRSLG